MSVQNRLYRPAETEYIPAVPHIPAREARCYTVERTVTYTENTTEYTRPPEFDEPEGMITGGGSQFQKIRGGSQSETKTKTVTEEVCVEGQEGQEGSPSEFIVDTGEDWLATAMSIEAIGLERAYQVNVNTRPRMMLGLVNRTTQTGTRIYQGDIAFGLLFEQSDNTDVHQVRRIQEGGVYEVLGEYVPGEPVAIGILNGRMFATLNGGRVRAVGDTVTSRFLADVLNLGVMLYSSEDYVENPLIAEVKAGAATGYMGFRARFSDTGTRVSSAYGFWGQVGGNVDGNVVSSAGGALTLGSQTGFTQTNLNQVTGYLGFSHAGNLYEQAYVNRPLPALAVLGAEEADFGQVRGVGPSVVLDSYGGTPDLNAERVALSLVPLGMFASGITGSVGATDEELAPLAVNSSEEPYGEVDVELAGLNTYSDWGISDDPNYYGHVQELMLAPSIYTEPVILASYIENFELGTAELSVFVAIEEGVIESLLFEDQLTVQDFVSRVVESGLRLTTTSGTIPQELIQYAFNMNTGAATRYDNYGFTGYVRALGRTFACAKDGIYEIKPGCGDDGEPVNALVDFGAMDFGSSRKKILETLFLGINTDGELFAKVYADGGRERIYRAVQPGPTRRFRTAKGLSAREWRLSLEVVDATEVDLTDVDFVVSANARRWTR